MFNLDEGNYYWLKPDSEPLWPDKELIVRDFSEDDLILAENFELTGFVHIEAGFDNARPWREIKWLENSCDKPLRTISSINLRLEKNKFKRQIKELKRFTSVTGVRHILNEDAHSLLDDKNVLQNFYYLAEQGLHFELQIDFVQAKDVKRFCLLLDDGLKDVLTVIINHAGFAPSIHDKISLYQWHESLKLLSQFSKCAIKCSGWEMVSRSYDTHQVKDTLTWCIEHFGFERVMIASNFPLCLFSQSYPAYWTYMLSLLRKEYYSEQQIKALCSQNAFEWYKFATLP